MNLQDFRNYPRAYLDLDVEDIPDTLIDRWAQEGSRRISRLKKNWPFYEASTTIPVGEGEVEYLVLLKDITSIEGPDGPLLRMDASEAERRYWDGTRYAAPNRPQAFSVWANKVRIWPTPDADYSLTARGFRFARDWVAEGAGATPDMPEDFDEVLLAWIMSNAYLHQDEPEQAAIQKAKFDEGLRALAEDELAAPTFTPIVLNSVRGGSRNGLPNALRFDGWVED